MSIVASNLVKKVGVDLKYISIILLAVFSFVGCSNFEVVEKQNKLKPEHTTVSTDRIELKEAVPFDLSTLYMRLFSLRMEDQDKYVMGFYYFGKEKADFEKVNLRINGEIHELLPRIPAESEEFGALGYSEEFYVRVPQKLLSNLAFTENTRLCVIGKGFKHTQILTSNHKKNIEKFINHRNTLALNN